MELQKQKRWLSITTACLLLCSAAVVPWAVSAIDESTPQVASSKSPTDVVPEISPNADLAISAAVTKRKLRQPLHDPEPTPPAPPKPTPPPAPRPKPAPKLTLSLVGTIIEANNSLAIIADADGQFDVKGIGETLEILPAGIVITKIQAEQVTLSHQGKKTILNLERDQKRNKGSSGNRNNRKRGLK